MTLGRKDFSVTRTDGRAHVFRLAGFLGGGSLIGHNGSFGTSFDRAMRTYSEHGGCARLGRAPGQARFGSTEGRVRAPEPDRRLQQSVPECVGANGRAEPSMPSENSEYPLA